MHDFLMKEVSENITQELISIGFDNSYIHKAREKFSYKNYKIFNLTCAQANILKQTALSVGADCATNKEVIIGKIEVSNVILGGSISQLKKIASKLELQPFNLKKLAEEILTAIKNDGKYNSQTKIIGILNITPDSFSDGGEYINPQDAIHHLQELINDGADIIDIGAETTKPFSKETPANTQLERLLPILKYIKENNIKIPISIDTRNATVAKECIKYGASLINDVSGFDYDSEMVKVLADNPNVKIIIQHSSGTPDIMQNNTEYNNLIDEIYFKLKQKIDFALSSGIKKENIIIDPGIGFGKTREQNFEIIKRWKEFRTLGCPILVGLSRKSLLNMSDSSNQEKDIYSLAVNSILINENIDYIRVHNVKMHKKLLEMIK